MNAQAVLLYACFFLSGASALVYETAWQRMLTLVVGLSTVSVAAVLSAFLAGLAIGARLFGTPADRVTRLLPLYAGIELGIAITGAGSAYIIPPLMAVFAGIHEVFEPTWLESNLIRLFLAFIALGIPSILIGATVPVMARLITLRAGSLRVGFGRFYVVNTAGAVFGCALTGLVLIQTVGVRYAMGVAVAGNVLAAGLALIASTLRGGRPGQAVPARTGFSRAHGTALTPVGVVLPLAAVTGAAALAYEVAWMRLMAVFTLNSVYVFSMVVSVYLAALTVGAGVATWLMRYKALPSQRLLVLIQVVLALHVPLLLYLIPAAGALGITRSDISAHRIILIELALTLATVFPPTLLIGMTLPLLVGMFSDSVAHSGHAAGRIYAWNSVGTIVGAAVTGVILIPLVGLRGTLLFLAAAGFFVAAVVTALDRGLASFWRAVPAAGAACFAILVAIGPATARFYRSDPKAEETVLYYAEGPSATVHVSEFAGRHGTHRALFVDSKSVAGTYDEIVTDQKMLAHLPLLLHPAPQHALSVGFGTGGTSFSMLLHRIRVDCVEIEPRVVDAFGLFKSQNHGIVGPDHERHDFHLIVDDARAWLHVSPHPYDVIVTDVTSIQYRGNGNLYTAEYFRLIHDNLAPGGLGCAWVPVNGITLEQFKLLVRTFRTVYVHTSVWYMINLPTDFAILVGTPERLRIDLADMAERGAQTLVQGDLALIGLSDPYKLAACLLLAEDDATAFAGDGPIHTDDRPILDYIAHASAYRNTLTTNLTELLRHRSDAADYVSDWPADVGEPEARRRLARWTVAAKHLIEGHALLHTDDPERAERAKAAYQAASELTPEDEVTRSLVKGLDDG